jgi:hypothetical protein
MGALPGLIQPEHAAATIATNPIGTGPYVLKSYTTNSTFEFEANPTYWGTKPTITSATVRIVTDGTAGLNALEAHEVDAVPVITIDLWEQLTKRELDKKFTLITYPQIGEPTYAVINQKLDPELRQAICEYVLRRGVEARPEDVVIVAGTQQAVSLCARVLFDPGDPVAIEEPQYYAARVLLQAYGAQLQPLTVDDQGLIGEALPTTAPRVIYTTPSHQFPQGGTEPPERRAALLEYAARNECWIIED